MQRSGNPFIRVSILDLMDSAIEMKEGSAGRFLCGK